jgi:cytidine deaminase
MMKPLEKTVELLKRHAMEAARHSYSPYSRFAVGAAVTGAECRFTAAATWRMPRSA